MDWILGQKRVALNDTVETVGGAGTRSSSHYSSAL